MTDQTYFRSTAFAAQNGTASPAQNGIAFATQNGTASPAQNEPTISDYINTFLSMNPKEGYLAFEVHQESPISGRVPVPNARITISKLLGDDYYISKVVTTDQNGETEPVRLPTVSRNLSQKPGEIKVFAAYNASVEAPGYDRKDIYDIQIFDGINSIQHVTMQPSVANKGAQPGKTGNFMG